MNDEYVWYVSYGSNLSRERFLCYIRGGKPIGSSIMERGCRDKSLPLKDTQMTIDLPLYFAQYSQRWNGGICFLGLESKGEELAFGRAYLITRGQFLDIVRQENLFQDINIDFDRVREEGFQMLSELKYGNIVYLGEKDGFAAYTFTSALNMDKLPFNAPSDEYLKVLIAGIKETYDLSKVDIVGYFQSKPGIKGFISRSKLEELVSLVLKNNKY